MPSKKARIGIGVVLMLLGMLLGPVLFEPAAMQTSYSKTPTGHRAVFDLLNEFRPKVERWRRTPLSLGDHNVRTDSSYGLLMLEPKPKLLGEGEAYLEAIVEWVREGNDLILVPRFHEAELAEVVGRKFEFHGETESYGAGIEALLGAAGLKGVILSTGESGAQSPNRLYRTTDGDQLQLPFALQLDGRDTAFESVWVARDDGGEPVDLLVDAAVGEGRIVVVLAPGLFWNKGLVAGDNGFAALNMLAEYGRDGLLIDEYYHGLPALDGFQMLLLTEPFLWLTVSFLFLASLVAWRSLVRSVPLVEPPLATRRSKREHVDAMGRLIASSDEEAWVVKQVLHGVQAEVRECLRLDPSTHLDSVLDFLRRSDEALADRLQNLVTKAPQGSGDHASKAAAVDWGRMSHAFLRDLHASRKAGARSHKAAPHP
ncbi:MAG: hypothetical protein ACI9C2_002540 [Gammaproteobacteria bacterium]|jgi:hypothetical protein